MKIEESVFKTNRKGKAIMDSPENPKKKKKTLRKLDEVPRLKQKLLDESSLPANMILNWVFTLNTSTF